MFSGDKYNVFDNSGQSRENKSLKAITVLQELRSFRPYLHGRLKNITDRGKFVELNKDVDDIRFYLEVIADTFADSTHGVDQLKSITSKLREMAYRHPLPEDATEDFHNSNSSTQVELPNPCTDEEKMGVTGNLRTEDYTNDWPRADSKDLFDNWEDSAWSTKVVQRTKEFQKFKEAYKDSWSDWLPTREDNKITGDPITDDGCLNMHFERRPKNDREVNLPQPSTSEKEQYRTDEGNPLQTRSWLQDPRIYKGPRQSSPTVSVTTIQNAKSYDNDWLYGSSSSLLQPSIYPENTNSVDHGHNPFTNVSQPMQTLPLSMPLFANHLANAHTTTIPRPCEPATLYVPGHGYITFQTAIGDPSVNSSPVPHQLMPSTHYSRPISQGSTFNFTVKNSDSQQFLHRNSNPKRKPISFKQHPSQESPTTAYDDEEMYVESDDFSFDHSHALSEMSAEDRIVRTNTINNYKDRYSEIGDRRKALEAENSVGNGVKGKSQGIRDLLETQGFFKLGQRSKVFEKAEHKEISSKLIRGQTENPTTTATDINEKDLLKGQIDSDAIESAKKLLTLATSKASLNDQKKIKRICLELGTLSEKKNKIQGKSLKKSKNVSKKNGHLLQPKVGRGKTPLTELGAKLSANSDSETSSSSRCNRKNNTGTAARRLKSLDTVTVDRASAGKEKNNQPYTKTEDLSNPIYSSKSLAGSPKKLAKRNDNFHGQKQQVSDDRGRRNFDKKTTSKRMKPRTRSQTASQNSKETSNNTKKNKSNEQEQTVTVLDDETLQQIMMEQSQTLFQPQFTKEGRQVIGRRDMIVNTGLCKIKLERDYQPVFDQSTVVKEENESEVEDDSYLKFAYPDIAVDVTLEEGNEELNTDLMFDYPEEMVQTQMREEELYVSITELKDFDSSNKTESTNGSEKADVVEIRVKEEIEIDVEKGNADEDEEFTNANELDAGLINQGEIFVKTELEDVVESIEYEEYELISGLKVGVNQVQLDNNDVVEMVYTVKSERDLEDIPVTVAGNNAVEDESESEEVDNDNDNILPIVITCVQGGAELSL